MASTAGIASTLKLIVVEDNPVIRELVRHGIDALERELGEARFEISEAADVATAWEQIQKAAFDLAVVDIYLPVLDGIELIRRIRENEDTADTRILAMSASIEDAKRRCLGAGADHFLQKPLRSEELLYALRSLLHLEDT